MNGMELKFAGGALAAALAFATPVQAQFNFWVKEPPATAGEYLGFCKANATSCEAYLQSTGKSLLEAGEKAKKPVICIPKEAAGRNDYERIHRWVVLRPDRHKDSTRAVITDAMKAIYPCGPEPKPAAKASAKAETKSEKK